MAGRARHWHFGTLSSLARDELLEATPAQWHRRFPDRKPLFPRRGYFAAVSKYYERSNRSDRRGSPRNPRMSGMHTATMATPARTRRTMILKRTLDVTLSALSLPLLLPAMILIAIAIKL